MTSKKLFYFISVSLRGATLFSKFALIIFLAKLLPVHELGVYGLISASITYSIFLIGFEFYTYSTREMIGRPKKEWLGMIRDQSIFYLIIYFVFIPVLYFTFHYELLPSQYIVWFALLMVFEHVAQEVNRILVAEQKQMLASIILFIRQGLWCWGALILMWLDITTRRLDIVFLFWFLGTFTACFIGCVHLFNFDRSSLRSKINWKWIKQGLTLAAPMLLASITIRGVFTFDRFFIDKIGGVEILGAYVLFISMTSAIQSFLDTVVITFAFPKLSRLNSEGSYDKFKKEMRKFSYQVIFVTIFFSMSCWLFGFWVLKWMSHEDYIAYSNIFLTLIIGTSIYCISQIPHLGLYALRCDIPIILSQVAAFGVFIITCCIGLYTNNFHMVPYALILAFSTLLVWKTWAFYMKIKSLKHVCRITGVNNED